MKMIRKLMSALSTLLVIVMVALAILLVGVRVVGLTPYAVLSGSMEPTYHVGSLIYVRRIEAQAIQPGTPLTFRTENNGMVVTHRVYEVLTENGETWYVTRGDANDMADPPISYAEVIGSPVLSIPYLGYFSGWLQSGGGIIAGAAFAALMLLSLVVSELLTEKKPSQPLPAGDGSPGKLQPGAAKSNVSQGGNASE